MSNPENEASLADGAKSGDEITLSDLVAFVRRHLAALLGGAILGGAVGLAIAFTLPAQWEASALVRVGQLGVVGTGGATPIEPLARVIARITHGAFEDDVLKRLGVPADDSKPQAGWLRGGIRVKLEKSDLIDLQVRGRSQDEAARFVDAAIMELMNVHAKMAEPTIARWRNEVEEIDLDLKRVGSETERLQNQLVSPSGMTKDNSSFQIGLVSYVLMSREAELRSMRERKRALLEQINPERTFATGPFGRVYVAKQPVFPRKSSFATIGLVIGMLGGLLLSMVRTVGTRRST